MNKFHIPDVRFEQTFLRLLDGYAGRLASSLSDKELQQLTAPGEDETTPQQPLPPITPSIVIYAVLKDQILMPLVQGFLFAGALLAVRPVLEALTRLGQHVGVWLATVVGIPRRQRG